MNNAWSVEVTMPRMLGGAIGFMISIPAPLENITGNKDRTIGTGRPGPITQALLDGYRRKAQALTRPQAAAAGIEN